jgi:hypothetical protein
LQMVEPDVHRSRFLYKIQKRRRRQIFILAF